MSGLTKEQISILDHTVHRASAGLYCGDGPNMDVLVERGLMEFAGRKSFVPDGYYRITPAGRELLKRKKSADSFDPGDDPETYFHQ